MRWISSSSTGSSAANSRWYLRYCDDFVLVANSPGQLAAWKEAIAQFLEERLALRLNPRRERLRPVIDGVDFLGYIVRPFHLLVRRRVVGHLRETLARSERVLVRHRADATEYRFDAAVLDALQASLSSYLGHFGRASCNRLLTSILARNAWLDTFFGLDRQSLRLRRRDRAPVQARTVLEQYRHWREEFPDDVVWIQVGAFVERLQWPPRRLGKRGIRGNLGLRRMGATRRGAVEGFPLRQLAGRRAALVAAGGQVTFVGQRGGDTGGVLRRTPPLRWVARCDGRPEGAC